jgi:uncharacterized protein YlxW (UPF0749 family)
MLQKAGMNRLLVFMVAVLLAVDLVTLTAVQRWRSQPPAPDLTPRVAQLETDLSQAQQDIGELKQEVILLQRRGQPSD